jgi:hypothetical protein
MRSTLRRRLTRPLSLAIVLVTLGLPLTGLYRAEAAAPIPVYVFAGQSNMVGDATSTAELHLVQPSAELPSPDVVFWGPTADEPRRWLPLQAPTEVAQPDSHQGFGPEVGAAPLLAIRNAYAKVAIVKLAQNGSNLHRHWNPERSKGLYRQLIDRVHYATARLREETNRPTRLAGLFWMQGESDAPRLEWARSYGTLLSAFISAVRRDLDAPGLPVVVGQIQDLRRTNPKLGRHSDLVRREQARVAREGRNVVLVPTDGLERSALEPIHFSTRGILGLGRRFARAAPRL